MGAVERRHLLGPQRPAGEDALTDDVTALLEIGDIQLEADRWAEALAAYETVSALLLDAYVPGVPGGTGHRFPWALAVDSQGAVSVIDSNNHRVQRFRL